MAKPTAQVRSVESLERLRSALWEFRREVSDALAILDVELHHVEEWIDQRQPLYWSHAVQKADRQLSQARLDLERCETAIRPDDRPSCHVQRKAYERARRRLAYCEEQLRVVKKWRVELERHLRNLRGRLGKLGDLTESEIPAAIAALERMIAALNQYLHVESPDAAAPTAATLNDRSSSGGTRPVTTDVPTNTQES